MVARKLVSSCRYTVQTVTQPAIRASVFLWAGNVKGGEGRGLVSTRISSSMRELQEEGTDYSGGRRQVIKLHIFLSRLPCEQWFFRKTTARRVSTVNHFNFRCPRTVPLISPVSSYSGH